MFQENLQKLVDNVEGGLAGLLMGFDGIAVDSYTKSPSPLDIQTVGMTYCAFGVGKGNHSHACALGDTREV
mgnify:CR=1 FL=1